MLARFLLLLCHTLTCFQLFHYTETFRIDGGRSDGMWCDLVDVNQNLFRFCGDVVIMLHDGHWIEFPGSTVIKRWPYGLDVMTPVEIASTMGLAKTMPTATALAAYLLTNGLMYPVSQHMFEFNYQQPPPLADTVRKDRDLVILTSICAANVTDNETCK